MQNFQNGADFNVRLWRNLDEIISICILVVVVSRFGMQKHPWVKSEPKLPEVTNQKKMERKAKKGGRKGKRNNY